MLQQFRFPCLDCSLSFRFSSHLKRHIRTHNGEAPFCCKHCSQCFKRKQHLAAHTSRVHSSSSSRLRCLDCDHSFTDRANLLRHALVMHRGLRRWVCGVCSGTYCHSADLRRHLLVRHSLRLPVLSYLHKRTRDQVYIFPEIGTHDITSDVKMKIEQHCKEELVKYQNVVASGVFDELYPKRLKASSCEEMTNTVVVVANAKAAERDENSRNDCFSDDAASMKLTKSNTGCSANHQLPTKVDKTNRQSDSFEDSEPERVQEVRGLCDLPDPPASCDSTMSDQKNLVLIEGCNQPLFFKIAEKQQLSMSACAEHDQSEDEKRNAEQHHDNTESRGALELVPHGSNNVGVATANEPQLFPDETESTPASLAVPCETKVDVKLLQVQGEYEYPQPSTGIELSQIFLGQPSLLQDKYRAQCDSSNHSAELSKSTESLQPLGDDFQTTACVPAGDRRDVSSSALSPLVMKNNTAQQLLHEQQIDDSDLILNHVDPGKQLFGIMTAPFHDNPIISHNNSNVNSLAIPVFLHQFTNGANSSLTSPCFNDSGMNSALHSDDVAGFKSPTVTSHLQGTILTDSQERTPFQPDTALTLPVQSQMASNELVPSSLVSLNDGQVTVRHSNSDPITSELSDSKQVSCEHSANMGQNTNPRLVVTGQTHPPHMLAHPYQIVTGTANQWHLLSGVESSCHVVPGHTISMVPVLSYQCSLCGLTFLSHQLCMEHVMTAHAVFGAGATAPPASLTEHPGEEMHQHYNANMIQGTILDASASYNPLDQIVTPVTEPTLKEFCVTSSHGSFLVQNSSIKTQQESLGVTSCRQDPGFSASSCTNSLSSSQCGLTLSFRISSDRIMNPHVAASSTDAMEADANHYRDKTNINTGYSSNANYVESAHPCIVSSPENHFSTGSDNPTSVLNSNINSKHDIFFQTEQFTDIESPSEYGCGAYDVTPDIALPTTSSRSRSEHFHGRKTRDCSSTSRKEHQTPTALNHSARELSPKTCLSHNHTQSCKPPSTPVAEKDKERPVITVTMRTSPRATAEHQVDRMVLSVGQGASETALLPWRQRAASSGRQLVLLSSAPSLGGDAPLNCGPDASGAVSLVRLECGTCGHRCSSAKQLTRHKRSHGTAQHRCSTCGRSFREKHNLAAHEATHAAARPSHPCPHCRNTYRHAKDLSEHVSRHHPGPDASPPEAFECEVCGEVFARLPHLTRHRKEQHASTLHECPVCGRCFKRLRYLELQHLPLHAKTRAPGSRAARKKAVRESCGGSGGQTGSAVEEAKSPWRLEYTSAC